VNKHTHRQPSTCTPPNWGIKHIKVSRLKGGEGIAQEHRNLWNKNKKMPQDASDRFVFNAIKITHRLFF